MRGEWSDRCVCQANNFCFEQDGIALARVDYRVDEDGRVVRSGSSCEVLRR